MSLFLIPRDTTRETPGSSCRVRPASRPASLPTSLPAFLPPLLPVALLVALLVGAGSAAASATGPAGAPGQPRSDTALTGEITAAIEEADLPIGLFEVEVRDGVAFLTGEVLNEATRRRVVEVTLFVEGVTAVETDLTVLQPDPEEGPEGAESAAGAEASAAGEDRVVEGPPPTVGDPGAVLARGLVAPSGRPSRPDEEVRAEVIRALEDADLEGGVPQVSVEAGIVRLTGQVAHAFDRGRVGERAGAVEGVTAVDADLEIAEPESAEDLADGVRRAVLRYAYYTVFDDINFGLEDDHRVVLLGAVTEPFKKDELEERVSKVFGVRGVDNRIEVLPLSPNDQDLRRALYYRIYRDSRFSDRANTVNPPIHIVVSRGVVALTGVVRSPVEARVLESIARSTPGVFRVVNRLQH